MYYKLYDYDDFFGNISPLVHSTRLKRKLNHSVLIFVDTLFPRNPKFKCITSSTIASRRGSKVCPVCRRRPVRWGLRGSPPNASQALHTQTFPPGGEDKMGFVIYTI